MENKVKRILVTEEEKKNILSLYDYKGILQEQKKLIKEGTIDWGEVGNDALVGYGVGVATGGALIIPGVTIGAAYSLIKQWYNSGGSRSAVQKLLQGCRAKGLGKTKTAESTIKYVVKNLFDAMEKNTAIPIFGATDEEGVKRDLEALTTIPDVCRAEKMYKQNYPGSTLFGDLDGEFNRDTEWREYVWQPLAQAFRNSIAENEKNYKKRKEGQKEKTQKNAEECGYFTLDAYKKAGWKCPSQILLNARKCGFVTIAEYKAKNWACPGVTPQEKERMKKENEKVIYYTSGGGGKGTSWNQNCKGTYSMGCKTPEVGQAQQCLKDQGLYLSTPDNMFGRKTKDAIYSKLGKNSFTDADLNTICKTTKGGGGEQEDLNIDNYQGGSSSTTQPKQDMTWTGTVY
jgi:hypothetical protein